MTVLISTQNLEKKFGDIHAVRGISLDVQKGEVLGFLGPNGAGKSTTMKMITGFLTPDTGTAEICGFDIVKKPIEAKRRIGYLPEGAPLYSDMTPHSFLNFIADIHGIDKSSRSDRIADAVNKTGLEPVYHQVIDTLSKGFKRRVGLAQAILNDPDVLILDEPTDGLDPNQKHLVRELISAMAKEKAIIISTHILEEVEAVCSRAVVIDQGRVIVDGTADELQGRSALYNAVTLKTAEASAGALIEKLEALEFVKQVETLSQMNGTKRLRAIPIDGKPIASDITSVIQEQGTVVQEIYVEQVRLDDVFRQLTTAEGE